MSDIIYIVESPANADQIVVETVQENIVIELMEPIAANVTVNKIDGGSGTGEVVYTLTPSTTGLGVVIPVERQFATTNDYNADAHLIDGWYWIADVSESVYIVGGVQNRILYQNVQNRPYLAGTNSENRILCDFEPNIIAFVELPTDPNLYGSPNTIYSGLTRETRIEVDSSFCQTTVIVAGDWTNASFSGARDLQTLFPGMVPTKLDATYGVVLGSRRHITFEYYNGQQSFGDNARSAWQPVGFDGIILTQNTSNKDGYGNNAELNVAGEYLWRFTHSEFEYLRQHCPIPAIPDAGKVVAVNATGDGYELIAATGGGGTGGIASIGAGSNISVNSADPSNPVVSAKITFPQSGATILLGSNRDFTPADKGGILATYGPATLFGLPPAPEDGDVYNVMDFTGNPITINGNGRTISQCGGTWGATSYTSSGNAGQMMNFVWQNSGNTWWLYGDVSVGGGGGIAEPPSDGLWARRRVGSTFTWEKLEEAL